MLLTDRYLKSLKPRGRDYTVTEKTRTRGQGRLVLRVRPTGTKEWMFVYWVNGGRRMKKLGTYPTLSLTEARERAGGLSKLYQDGVDVREHLAEQDYVNPLRTGADHRLRTLKQGRTCLGSLCIHQRLPRNPVSLFSSRHAFPASTPSFNRSKCSGFAIYLVQLPLLEYT